MSFNKRKIFVSDTSDEDDSFKHRRSSLRVNLSYSDNLTDSGNGSLWRTEIENNERGADAAQTVTKVLGRKSIYEKNCQSDFGNKNMSVVNDKNKCATNNNESIRIKEGIQLKHLTINLEDISTKERYLETSCNRLKDAILSKTKQIFDRENELSIKTAMVLKNKENYLASSTHNTRNETVMLDMTDHLKTKAVSEDDQYINNVNNTQREDHSNIVATPTKSDKRKSLERTVDKSRLTQKRLFVEEDKQVGEQIKCRIIENVVLEKNFPSLSVRQADQSGSPILSGSNKRLSLRRKSKLLSQNRVENLNNTFSTIHSIQNSDIEMPIVCSTFIEDNATDEEKINNNVDTSRATHTTNKVTSMEITEVQGGIHMSEKHVSVQNRNLYTNNCNENSKEKKSREGIIERNKKGISSRLDIEQSISKTTASDVLRACDSKTKCQNKKCCISPCNSSSNTIRSSLNVNTSLNAVTETSKERNVWKSSDHRTNKTVNQDFKVINKESTVLNDQRESANTIRTSLQMNTSVDSMRKTWRRISDKDDKDRNHSNMNVEYSTENKKTNDIDFLENISLIERLRNISMRSKVSDNDKLKPSRRNEDKRYSSNRNSYSYAEGTPYPINHSVLFRSQYKTQHSNDTATCDSDSDLMDNEENNDKIKSFALHSKVSNEMHMSTKIQKTIEADAFVKDTHSHNSQLTVTEDMPDKTKSKTGENMAVQNTECIPVRRGRRKLLSLTEDSLCSISPIEEMKSTPITQESTSAKRKKGLKKKLPKRKSMRSKNNANNIKQDAASKQAWSDSDCDIPKNKKKENKKTRKPKKVISKKITIKKFADENVLNILQGNRQNKENYSSENKDSLDDFVKSRIISTQWNKYKSQKIIIVTTGLSKEDKSLVKNIVKSLGAAELELNVTRRTTHVVSTGVRTVNLLRGIIRGCWLITLEWVLKSLENNAWLDPETFEMKHFSKAVQENRKDRQLFGLSYIPELFSACGFIHVEHKTTVPCDTLKELIKTAGGHITENIKLAKIIIGTNGLKETWVIDCITTGELQLTKLYQWNDRNKQKVLA